MRRFRFLHTLSTLVTSQIDHCFSAEECRLAVENALRYFPASSHAILAPEFAQELRDFGHIYMYR